jgi:hypothetical protein
LSSRRRIWFSSATCRVPTWLSCDRVDNHRASTHCSQYASRMIHSIRTITVMNWMDCSRLYWKRFLTKGKEHLDAQPSRGVSFSSHLTAASIALGCSFWSAQNW